MKDHVRELARTAWEVSLVNQWRRECDREPRRHGIILAIKGLVGSNRAIIEWYLLRLRDGIRERSWRRRSGLNIANIVGRSALFRPIVAAEEVMLFCCLSAPCFPAMLSPA